MEFEWDENKRREGIKEHGVDMVYAALIFEGRICQRVDGRKDYGEQRLISTGFVDGTFLVVVHTQRGSVTRLISAWKGGRNDRRDHEARLAGRDSQDEGGG